MATFVFEAWQTSLAQQLVFADSETADAQGAAHRDEATRRLYSGNGYCFPRDWTGFGSSS